MAGLVLRENIPSFSRRNFFRNRLMLLRDAECLPRGPLRDRRYRLFQLHIENGNAVGIIHLYFPIDSVLRGDRGLTQQAQRAPVVFFIDFFLLIANPGMEMEDRVKRQAIDQKPAIADSHSALFSQVASGMPSGCWCAGSQLVHEHRDFGGGWWHQVSDWVRRRRNCGSRWRPRRHRNTTGRNSISCDQATQHRIKERETLIEGFERSSGFWPDFPKRLRMQVPVDRRYKFGRSLHLIASKCGFFGRPDKRKMN